MSDQLNTPSLSRRRLLGSAGAVGLGLVIAACGSDNKAASTTAGGGTTPGSNTTLATAATTPATTAPTDGGSVDLKVAKLAASLEVLAVGTYKAALDAATAGKLGTVPAAVGEFVTKAMSQHQAHLDAWNKVLTGAGETAVTEPNATLKPTVDAAFG